MQFKDYQTDVLETLGVYLRTLAAKRDEALEYAEFQRGKGREVQPGDYCRDAWDALHAEKVLPLARDAAGNFVQPPYVPRKDGMGRPLPNICLKLPTGGGKTLLACAAIERINPDYFHAQTGLVLWVVPSESIYAQTWRAFANREHWYRQMLERASGGRVKLLERGDAFTRQDAEHHLCVMLLMLQASARKTKEQLKMFQDSGRFMSFFPDVDDFPANQLLRAQVQNLDVAEMTDQEFRGDALIVKQSLGNVLRIARPLVVIDEGHKAYSDIAFRTLCGFNPRFILELSATPNSGREHISNVLVNVTGGALRDEQMIKLPINLINESRADWKHALAAAKEKLDELQKASERVRNNEGRYVRPILLVRVERTGKEQREKSAIHSEDAREYLIEKLGALPEQIKVKSAELNELGDEDLLSEYSKVRYIITKDALREGWDCPFAYVLAVLSKMTAATALTQMIGRVLRQPEAKITGEPKLNECYVFTFDQEVQAAVESVRRGLEQEGMGDLGAAVRAAGKAGAVGSRRESIARRKEFQGMKIFLPRVLARHPVTGDWRLLDYDRDLLSRVDWNALSYTDRAIFTPDEKEALQRTLVRVSVEDLAEKSSGALPRAETREEDAAPELDLPALVRLLLDVVPNPWQGARIVNETLAELRRRRISEQRICTNRLFLLKAMRDDLRRQVHQATETEFRHMLSGGEICFRLEASGDPRLNWELAETFEFDVTDDDRVLLRKTGEAIEKSLFDRVYQRQFNGLEKEVGWYLDAAQAVRWWHRIAVHQDYHLQGWQRARIYPDFLVCLQDLGDGVLRLSVLETKGMHLKGNDDTDYKRRLFDLFNEYSESALPVGELKLSVQQQVIRFQLLLEDNWGSQAAEALKAPTKNSMSNQPTVGRK
jgi:type III restriction enzyme